MGENIAERLSCKKLYDSFVRNNVGYFFGVPDSLVGSFSLFLEANIKKQHLIAANEGNAIAAAIGYHASTAKIPLVYMQNSGLGNAIDPLVSLADPSVFSTPMILLISWRGQPGKKDEPQHEKQGAITCTLLDMLDIPYVVLSKNSSEALAQVEHATKNTTEFSRPYALLVEKDTFEDFEHKARPLTDYPLSREQAVETVIQHLDDSDVVVASIGKLSRELYEYRDKNHQTHVKDLLIVGGMGHASSIALGVAEQKPDRRVYCLDGDGSVLMHMGSLATIGSRQLKNFHHILFNNGLHDSVGGQPTAGFETDLTAVAKACGYTSVYSVHESADIKKYIESTKNTAGSILLEIRVHSGARDNLTRPSISPLDNKKSFMAFLSER